MKYNLPRMILAAALVTVSVAHQGTAMEMNLALPYASKIALPARAELAFYAKSSDDLLFADGREIEIYCRAGLRSVGLKYSVRRNTFITPFISGTADALPANTFVIRIPTERLPFAGFYDLAVELDCGEPLPIKGLCTFGWNAGQMKITDSRPADFDEFWRQSKAELEKIPLEATVSEFKSFTSKEIDAYNLASAAIPADYDPAGHRAETVESAKVTFNGALGARVHGWLAKPTGSGPFPAMLVMPGGGINARPRPLEHARHGYVALDIQAHGLDVDLEKYPVLPGYYDKQIYEPVRDFYFHRIYMNSLQALNYLLSRADVDPKRIVVVGGSQGGRTAIVVGALDQRVAAIVPAIPHHGYIPYTTWATVSNKAKTDGTDRETPPPPTDIEQRCLAYYDNVNFAPDVRCPVFMNAGLVDGVSPAECVYATFLRLGSADKTLVPLAGMAHDWSAEFDRRAWRWLEERLKNR